MPNFILDTVPSLTASVWRAKTQEDSNNIILLENNDFLVLEVTGDFIILE